MKHIFIINPLAGQKRSAEIEISDQLRDTDIDYEIYTTTGPGDATRYIRERCKNDSQPMRFYACGGDGTLKETADGVVGFSHAELSCYPIGSGNDFVKYYGGKERFMDLPSLCNMEAHDIDLIKVGDSYSINVCNFGFDACVAETMQKVKRKKVIGGSNAYTTGIAKAVFVAMKNHAKVYADGELLNPKGTYLLCTIANGKYVGGSYKCAPYSSNCDGYLEVGFANPISIFTFLALIGKYKLGTHLEDPRFKKFFVYRRVKEVCVVADKEIAITLDGEIQRTNEFTATVVHKAIKFAAPPPVHCKNSCKEKKN